MVNQRYKKYKSCAHCKEENLTQNKYCSEWCLDEVRIQKIKIVVKKEKVEKPPVLRLCSCGSVLGFNRSKCDDCLSKNFSEKRKYIISEIPCLNCGGEVTTRAHYKHIKKFCEHSCYKAYYYKLKSNGK